MASSSSQSRKYDVFLSFRGEDTRKTFVDHLYSTLVQHLIQVYKDDETLPRGESISPSLYEAIEESQIAVIVFSKNYADSSWCLEELTHIMKCKNERDLIAIPIFYDVEPTDVRNQKNKFGEAFTKQEGKTRAEMWRKALVEVSNISGWECKNIADGHESQFIKKVVDTVLDRLFILNTCVDEDLVGMRARFHDLESLLDIGSSGVCMVGIWGVGGGGKTTLATSIYMEISQHFQACCIIENVREETNMHGLKKLQENILTALFQKSMVVHSVVEGKRMMKSMLCRRKVLVLLDDVDKLDQLEALVGKHNWFGSGSRIIITTRDEHLLRTHKVDHIYPITLLSHDEAMQLFKRHAYNEEDPVDNYETLSSSVVSYAAGLPLAIKVLGTFLYDKSKNEWISTLEKLKDIADLEIMEILKVSYDGLDSYQKELFLDIACFWRSTSSCDAMEILEACGYHPTIGIKILIQKSLITIVNGRFDMHDLIQELGHYIVRGEHPNSPERHSRIWKQEEIEYMSFQDETMAYDNTEAIIVKDRYLRDMDIGNVAKMVSKMKKLRLLIVLVNDLYENDDDDSDEVPNFLSNELRYVEWHTYPSSSFPHNFQPMKLVVLKLRNSMQEELWKGYKHLPHLKELNLKNMKKLLYTPDFDGLPHLKDLTLNSCKKLEEIHPSFGNHTGLESLKVSNCKKLKRIPKVGQMKNVKALVLRNCYLNDGDIPCGIGELSNLQELNLSCNRFSRLDFSLSQLTRLKILNVSFCYNLIELHELPPSLAILTAQGCTSLTLVEDFYKSCKWLCQVSLKDDGWSDLLLKFMLKGKAIENDSMFLQLHGVEIPKGLTPPLQRGRRCRLELLENWCNDFSGFLIYIVNISDYAFSPGCTWIRMKKVSSKDSKDDVVRKESDDDKYAEADSQDDVLMENSDGEFEDDMISEESECSEDDAFWEESSGGRYTWVWYVSFSLLRHTVWWDQTYKSLSFEIEDDDEARGFKVRLIEKKSTSGLTETSTDSSQYTPKIKIEHDSKSKLVLSLTPYGQT